MELEELGVSRLFEEFYIQRVSEEEGDELFPDLFNYYEYYTFYDYKDNYLGAVAYRQFAEDNLIFNEWHTNFVTPTRKVLAEWQGSIGGIWLAIMSPDNPNLNSIRHALEKGDFLDVSDKEITDQVLYMKEY